MAMGKHDVGEGPGGRRRFISPKGCWDSEIKAGPGGLLQWEILTGFHINTHVSKKRKRNPPRPADGG